MKAIVLALSFSLLALSACQPAQQPTNPQSPAPVPSSALPSVSPASPTPTPVSTPTASASPLVPTPTSTPIPVPTITPTPVPTATPAPTTGSLLVQVFNEDNRIVVHSSVTIRSLDPTKPYDKSIDLQDSGQILLDDVPARVTLEVSATAPAYTVQKRQIVLDPGQSFKLVFEDDLAISNKPEIIAVEPGNPAKVGVFDPIVLVFNESMDQDSVENSIALQLDDQDDSNFDVGTVMPAYESIIARPDNTVYDQGQLEFDWENNRRLVIRPQYGWPVGSADDFRLVLTYIDKSGNGGTILDTSGNEARDANDSGDKDGPFRVGNRYEPYLRVQVLQDDLPNTRLDDVFADNENDRDRITLRFDRDLRFNIATGEAVVGGASGSAASALAAVDGVSAQEAVENYRLTCNGDEIAWPSGSAAVFSGSDEVVINIPENIFDPGDSCTIEIQSGLDIFGQRIQGEEDDFKIPS